MSRMKQVVKKINNSFFYPKGMRLELRTKKEKDATDLSIKELYLNTNFELPK